MVVTSDFGSESPGSSPGSPTKRDNLMKAIKDKKKFGGTSLVLMHLPISREEIQKAWSNPYVDSSTLGVPYMWDGIGYYERWVEQVYNKLNNVT